MSLKAVVVVSLLVLIVSCWMSEGRYLPTRGDDTRREEIREFLRELLEGAVEKRDYEKRFLVKRAADINRTPEEALFLN